MVMQKLASNYNLMLVKKTDQTRIEAQQNFLYKMKRKAHMHIDWIVQNGHLERQQVYDEIAYQLERPEHEVHLSNLQDPQLAKDIVQELRRLRSQFSYEVKA